MSEGKTLIPKKIHYCWFGRGEKPKLAQKCIASWKKYCPDYEIIEWNEDNFDININGYTRMCYEQKKYAFLSDYVRLWIIKEYGGLYFDTDVEVLRNYDELLIHNAFFGFESEQYVNTGIGFGAEACNAVVCKLLEEYNELINGDKGIVGCPVLNTIALEQLGLKRNGKEQMVDNARIYPLSYFNPYEDATGRLNITKHTYSIHWYAKSWLDKKVILRSKVTKVFHRLFGINCFSWLKRK